MQSHYNDHSLQLYPSANAIIILHASSLQLLRVLAFSEAFPNAEDSISSVSLDPGMKLVSTPSIHP